MRRAVLIFGLIAAVGCTTDTPGTSVARDSAGITIIENVATPAVPEVTGELQLSIGVEEGPLEYQFYRVTGLARLTDGRIVVGEAESGRLRWFDAEGQLLLQAGGRGSGPGEFRYISAVVPMPNDTVAVWGGLLDPVSIFDSMGVFVRQEPLDRGRIADLVGPGRITEGLSPLPDGSFVLQVLETREGPAPIGQVYRPPLEYHRVSRDYATVDTLGQYGGFPQVFVDVGRAQPTPAVLDFPVHARLSAGGTPLQIYAGDGDRFEVHTFDSNGSLNHIIRLDSESRPVGAEDLEMARGQTLEWAEREGREAEMERIFAALPKPTEFPAYDALQASSEGGIWVRSWVAPTDSLAMWYVFDVSGSLQERVSLPSTFSPHQIGDSWVLGVERDSLEVERVRMYRIQ